MSLPTQLGAYESEIELFDRALEDEVGVRVNFGTDHAKAKQFQLRLHQARSLQRAQNRRLYPIGDKQYDTSPWEGYIVKVLQDVAGEWWVYICKRSTEIGDVENLSEIES